MIFRQDVVDLFDILLGNALENEPTIARLVVRDARLVRFVERDRRFSQRILATRVDRIVHVQRVMTHSKAAVVHLPVLSERTEDEWTVLFDFEMARHDFPGREKRKEAMVASNSFSNLLVEILVVDANFDVGFEMLRQKHDGNIDVL